MVLGVGGLAPFPLPGRSQAGGGVPLTHTHPVPFRTGSGVTRRPPPASTAPGTARPALPPASAQNGAALGKSWGRCRRLLARLRPGRLRPRAKKALRGPGVSPGRFAGFSCLSHLRSVSTGIFCWVPCGTGGRRRRGLAWLNCHQQRGSNSLSPPLWWQRVGGWVRLAWGTHLDRVLLPLASSLAWFRRIECRADLSLTRALENAKGYSQF